jgi:hypothetical protein
MLWHKNCSIVKNSLAIGCFRILNSELGRAVYLAIFSGSSNILLARAIALCRLPDYAAFSAMGGLGVVQGASHFGIILMAPDWRQDTSASPSRVGGRPTYRPRFVKR